jgi:hypothetical protein
MKSKKEKILVGGIIGLIFGLFVILLTSTAEYLGYELPNIYGVVEGNIDENNGWCKYETTDSASKIEQQRYPESETVCQTTEYVCGSTKVRNACCGIFYLDSLGRINISVLETGDYIPISVFYTYDSAGSFFARQYEISRYFESNGYFWNGLHSIDLHKSGYRREWDVWCIDKKWFISGTSFLTFPEWFSSGGNKSLVNAGITIMEK